ncbi:hypothetical protein JCM8547_001422 [Rhodosporidiobolus lusitaniae]
MTTGGGNYDSSGITFYCPSDTPSSDTWQEYKSEFDNGMGGTTFTAWKKTSGAGCTASFTFTGKEGYYNGAVDGGETFTWYSANNATFGGSQLCIFGDMDDTSHTIVMVNGDGNLLMSEWWWTSDGEYQMSETKTSIAAPETSTSSSPSSSSTSSTVSTASSPSDTAVAISSLTSSSTSSSSSLTNGTKLAGIVTGVLVLLAIVAALVICGICTRTRKKGAVVVTVKRGRKDSESDEEEEKSLGVSRRARKRCNRRL